MGNKISLGKCVIYCGFSGQRKKTKRKEEEARQEAEELERYQIWLRAEKFKADFPEYCIQAGIPASSIVADPQCSGETSAETRRFKAHPAPAVKHRGKVPEKHTSAVSEGVLCLSDESSCDSPANNTTLPGKNVTGKKKRSIKKIRLFRTRRKKPKTAEEPREPDSTQEKKIVSVKSIYKNRNKKSVAYKSEHGTSQNPAEPINSQDATSKHASIVASTVTFQAEDDQTKNTSTSTNGSLKVTNTNSNISFQHCVDSHVQSSPGTSAFNNRSDIQHQSSDHKIESESRRTEQSNTVEGRDVLGESNQDKSRDESSLRQPSSIEEFTPSHNSTMKPLLLPPDVQIRRSEFSKRSKSYSPDSRDFAPLRPPTPMPSAFSYDRSSRGRSVTFNSSFDDFQECLQSSRISSSTSSETILSANEESRQFISKQIGSQQIKKRAVHDDNPRASQKFKPCSTSKKLQSNRSLPLFKWNGRCVYDSGYPSIMVGDRIESASEDEDFWEKRLENLSRMPPVKRHVFGDDIPQKDDLIPAQKLYKDFEADEVDVYLKERREQCNLWHYGIESGRNVDKKQTTSAWGIQNTSRLAIEASGSIPKQQFVNAPVYETLKTLQDEVKEIRKNLRTNMPRIVNSIERRQRVLEAHVDVLASRDTFVTFPAATGDKNVNQNLKESCYLEHDKQHKSTEKREQNNHDMVLKCQDDIFIEDIEDDMRMSGNEQEIEEHQSDLYVPKSSTNITEVVRDFDVISNCVKEESEMPLQHSLGNTLPYENLTIHTDIKKKTSTILEVSEPLRSNNSSSKSIVLTTWSENQSNGETGSVKHDVGERCGLVSDGLKSATTPEGKYLVKENEEQLFNTNLVLDMEINNTRKARPPNHDSKLETTSQANDILSQRKTITDGEPSSIVGALQAKNDRDLDDNNLEKVKSNCSNTSVVCTPRNASNDVDSSRESKCTSSQINIDCGGGPKKYTDVEQSPLVTSLEQSVLSKKKDGNNLNYLSRKRGSKETDKCSKILAPGDQLNKVFKKSNEVLRDANEIGSDCRENGIKKLSEFPPSHPLNATTENSISSSKEYANKNVKPAKSGITTKVGSDLNEALVASVQSPTIKPGVVVEQATDFRSLEESCNDEMVTRRLDLTDMNLWNEFNISAIQVGKDDKLNDTSEYRHDTINELSNLPSNVPSNATAESVQSNRKSKDDLNEVLVTSVQSPTIRPGVVVEQITSARTLEGICDDHVVSERLQWTDQSSEPTSIGICQRDNSCVESKYFKPETNVSTMNKLIESNISTIQVGKDNWKDNVALKDSNHGNEISDYRGVLRNTINEFSEMPPSDPLNATSRNSIPVIGESTNAKVASGLEDDLNKVLVTSVKSPTIVPGVFVEKATSARAFEGICDNNLVTESLGSSDMMACGLGNSCVKGDHLEFDSDISEINCLREWNAVLNGDDDNEQSSDLQKASLNILSTSGGVPTTDCMVKIESVVGKSTKQRDTIPQCSGFLSSDHAGGMEDIIRHRTNTDSLGVPKSKLPADQSRGSGPNGQFLKNTEESVNEIDNSIMTHGNNTKKSASGEDCNRNTDLKTIPFESVENRAGFSDDDLVFQNDLRRISQQSKCSPSSEEMSSQIRVVSSKKDVVSNAKIGLNVASPKESEIQPSVSHDKVPSKLSKESPSSKEIESCHHKKLNSNSEKIVKLDVKYNLEVSSSVGSKNKVASNDDDFVSDGELHNAGKDANGVTEFGNDWKCDKVNFDHFGIKSGGVIFRRDVKKRRSLNKCTSVILSQQKSDSDSEIEKTERASLSATINEDENGIAREDPESKERNVEHNIAQENEHDRQYLHAREVEHQEVQISNNLASHNENGTLNANGISGYLKSHGNEMFKDEDDFLQTGITDKKADKSSKMINDTKCIEIAEENYQRVFGKGQEQNATLKNHSDDEVAEKEHHTIIASDSKADIKQGRRKGKRGDNLKLTSHKPEKTNMNLSKNNVVLRSDLQKMMITDESESSQARSSYDEIVVDGEGSITNETYEVPDKDECVFITHDGDSSVGKECKDENFGKSPDYGVDNKKMLDDYFKKYVEVREDKVVAGVEINIHGNDTFGGTRQYDGNDKKDKQKREISRKELNEILQEQEERKKDADYYEIGNFDRLIEEILDGGAGNVDEREDSSVSEICASGSSLYEISNEGSFAREKRNYGFTNDTKLGKTYDDAVEDNTSKSEDEQLDAKNKNIKVKKKIYKEEEVDYEGKGSKISVSNSSQRLHVENVVSESLDKNKVKIHVYDNRKKTTHEALEKDNTNDARKYIVEKEMYSHEGYNEQDKKDGMVRPDHLGSQSKGCDDLYDKNHKNDGDFGYMSSVESLPGSANLQTNYSSYFTQSSILQHDSGTTTSLERSSGDRKSPNLVMADVDTTCSEYMSSPEPSLQEDAFLGSIDFMGIAKGKILSQTDNSSLSMPLHHLENLELISKMAKTNTSTENRNGYISESDFDTSFSDNLSYVEQGLLEEEREITDGINKIENDDFDDSESQSVRILDDMMSNKELSQQETNTGAARIYSNSDVSKCGKENLRHAQQISDMADAELDHSVVSQRKTHSILGTDLTVNGKLLTTSATDRTCSLANANSIIDQTELPGIRSSQKSSHQIIFGNVEVVALTPGKEIRSDNQENVVKYMISDVGRHGTTEKSDCVAHSGTNEETEITKNIFITKNQEKNVRKREAALEDDFLPCSSDASSETKDFQLNEEIESQRKDSIKGLVTKDILGNERRRQAALEDDFLPCSSDASSETKDFQLNEEVESQRKDSIKGLVTKDIVGNERRRQAALEDDFLPCSSEASSETKDFQLNEEIEIHGTDSIKRLVTKDTAENERRRQAALEDDFLLCSSEASSETKDFQLNEEIEIHGTDSIKRLVTKDTAGNERRRQAALEDDFLLCSSDVSSETKDFQLNEEIQIQGKDSIKRLVTKYTAGNERRREAALEDDFVPCGEPPSCTSSNDGTGDINVERLQYDRQILFGANNYEDEVKNFQHPKVSLEDKPNEKYEMKQPYQDMIQDPDYQLNTLSDISSISDMSLERETRMENRGMHENVREQETNSNGHRRDELLATNLVKESIHLDNKGAMKSPLTQSKAASPDSHAMTQLRKIMQGVVLTSATRNVSAQIEMKKELEKKQREEEKDIYDRKELGTRCLEKFRDGILKPRSASPNRRMSYQGIGATMQSPVSPKLESRSMSGLGRGVNIENVITKERLEHSPINDQYQVNRELSYTLPTYDPCPQPSDDEDSYIQETCQRTGLAMSHNNIRQTGTENVNNGRPEPAYRTPECRLPAALVPLNVGESAPELASKVAGVQASLGFGSSDPWKPKLLPGIKEEGMTPRRSDSRLLKQKSTTVPRFALTMKPAALPDIGQYSLRGRALPGTKADRGV